MSEGNPSECFPSFPVIKVHILMPGASSPHDSEYVSIKYSKTTTAQEVIDHIKHKKARFPNMLYIHPLANISAEIASCSLRTCVSAQNQRPANLRSERQHRAQWSSDHLRHHFEGWLSVAPTKDASATHCSPPSLRLLFRMKDSGGFVKLMKIHYPDWYPLHLTAPPRIYFKPHKLIF